MMTNGRENLDSMQTPCKKISRGGMFRPFIIVTNLARADRSEKIHSLCNERLPQHPSSAALSSRPHDGP